MSNYNPTLKAAIAAAIHSPADPKITGAALQEQLLSIVESIDAGALFMGAATPATVPGTQSNAFYLATATGTYESFLGADGNALAIADGEAALLRSVWSEGNLRWEKATLPVGDNSAKVYDPTSLETGYWGIWNAETDELNIPPSSNALAQAWRRLRVAVKKGDQITLKTKGGTSGRAYALTDSDGVTYSYADRLADYTDDPATLTAAKNGYLYVNCNADHAGKFSLSVKAAEAEGTAVADTYNPKANLAKPGLKVLFVGNSYTNNMTTYLPDLIEAAGIGTDTFSIYKATVGGGSFKKWYDIYNDEGEAYAIGKVAGKTLDGIATGQAPAGDGSSFRAALSNARWDIVVVQHASAYLTDYDSWSSTTGAGGYMTLFLPIVRSTNPQASIGFVLCHSYSDDYQYNPEHSSDERWIGIVEAAKSFCAAHDVSFLVPYGTAIQSLRGTGLNDNANDFTHDGTHLAAGIGRYTAAACLFQALIAPHTGKSIVGNTYTNTSVPDDPTDGSTGIVQITADNARLAQIAAFKAVYDPYSLSEPSASDVIPDGTDKPADQEDIARYLEAAELAEMGYDNFGFEEVWVIAKRLHDGSAFPNYAVTLTAYGHKTFAIENESGALYRSDPIGFFPDRRLLDLVQEFVGQIYDYDGQRMLTVNGDLKILVGDKGYPVWAVPLDDVRFYVVSGGSRNETQYAYQFTYEILLAPVQ